MWEGIGRRGLLAYVYRRSEFTSLPPPSEESVFSSSIGYRRGSVRRRTESSGRRDTRQEQERGSPRVGMKTPLVPLSRLCERRSPRRRRDLVRWFCLARPLFFYFISPQFLSSRLSENYQICIIFIIKTLTRCLFDINIFDNCCFCYTSLQFFPTRTLENYGIRTFYHLKED